MKLFGIDKQTEPLQMNEPETKSHWDNNDYLNGYLLLLNSLNQHQHDIANKGNDGVVNHCLDEKMPFRLIVFNIYRDKVRWRQYEESIKGDIENMIIQDLKQ